MKKDNFGIIALIAAIVMFIVAIVIFVTPLPVKTATIVTICWVFGPAIVGSVVYCIMESKGKWRQDTDLK
ncbi:MAG: hypothetical protein IKQ69_00370 [Oscillospiraceae bacterium]|nr:hypothetical protein [Oscillospiraceae bacterium]